jgi:catechol 2,3-dioxygenase-like lactoylglutathione lyase family enzyme
MSPSNDGPFQVEQVDHVELFVPSRRAAAAWYRRILGLEVVAEFESWAEDPRGPLMIATPSAGTKLALFRGESQGGRPTAGFHLVAFRVTGEGFLQFLRRLPELDLQDHLGRELTADLAKDHHQAWSIYFSDPWGHRLEITTYDHEAVARARESG